LTHPIVLPPGVVMVPWLMTDPLFAGL